LGGGGRGVEMEESVVDVGRGDVRGV